MLQFKYKIMKRFIYISTLFIGSLMINTKVNAQSDLFDKIAAAIIKNNAADVGPLSTAVAITIPGMNGTISAQQTTTALKGFFVNYPVTGFTIGTKKTTGNTPSFHAAMKTGNGHFDAFFSFRNVGGKFLITEIHFNPG